ncbi:hypothetical protein C0989_010223 [Termitomyces sp. Mn162]|nr:hypothetical protein C0989_010223 [Termitomyces sp. Mn162]
MSSSNLSATASNDSDSPSESVNPATCSTVYPPQRHAGKVGYGPQYHIGPTIGEKVKGYEEELKGHLTHNHALVEHGRMMVSGELKRKEREHDMNSDTPFQKTEDEHRSEKDQGATMSPSSSHTMEDKKAEAADDVKHIG